MRPLGKITSLAMTSWAVIAGFAFFVRFDQVLANEFHDADRAVQNGARSDDVGSLIEQLGSPEFSERRTAGRRLSDLGAAAIPGLIKVVSAGETEAATRAFEILKRHARSDNTELQQAAKQGLETISADKLSRFAAAARDLIDGSELNVLGGFGRQNVTLKRLVSRSANGIRNTEIEENDRKIKLHEEKSGRIRVEITEADGDKMKTNTIEAKDAEELKTKDADAHRIYQLYGRPTLGTKQGIQQNGVANRRAELHALRQTLGQVQRQVSTQLRNANTPNEVARLQNRLQLIDQQRQELDILLRQLP